MPLEIINMFGKVSVTLNGLEVSVVAHRDGEVEYIGDKIRCGSCD